jgi:hypothetical protein
MKTSLLFQRMVLLMSLLCISMLAQATHFRYGSLTYQTSGATNRTVQFKLSVAYREDYFGAPPKVGQVVQDVGYLEFGDGTDVLFDVTVTAVGDDYFYGEYTTSHTYATAGNFKAVYTGSARISTLQNNPDGEWYISTLVNAGSANDSPVSTLPPIVNLAAGQAAATYTVPAGDPNGNALTYSVATAADLGGIAFTNAPGLAVNPTTGVVTFSTVGKTVGQFYNAVIKISDGLTSIVVDHLIQIVGQTSTAPSFVYPPTPPNGQVFTVNTGQLVTFSVRATDSDAGDIVTLQALGLPTGATMSPALPTSGNPVQSTFAWTPTAANIGTTIINFIAQDKQGTQRSTSVTIQVVNGCNLQLTTAVTNAGCGTLGAINLSVAGGTGPYTYAWTGPNGFTASTEDLTGLAAGTYSVTVTDNATQCTATTSATVGSSPDTTPPVVLAAGFTTALASNGTRTIEAVDVDYGSYDECSGIASLSISPRTFTCANVGPNQVTLTVTDKAGNVASQTVTVIIVDNTAPIVLAAGLQVNLVNGTRTIEAADIDYGSYDECGSIASMTLDRTTFTCANVGPNQVTLTVTDKAGNKASQTVTVVVVDNTAPVLRVAGFTTQLQNGTRTIEAADIDYGSYDDCGSIASISISPRTFTCANVGPNQVTVTVTDKAGNVSSQTVTVLITADATCTPAVAAHNLGAPNQLEAYPNPAKAQATLRFVAQQTGAAQLQVYNSLGERVATLYDGVAEQGQVYERTLGGTRLPAGLYTCRFTQQGKTVTQRLVLTN